MEIKDLNDLIKFISTQNISQKKPGFNKILHNFEYIIINEDNGSNSTIFSKKCEQNFMIINDYEFSSAKYLIASIKNLFFIILSTKLSHFISFLEKNRNIDIISLSNDSINLLNDYAYQNNIKLLNKITDSKEIPFYEDEIDQFLIEIPCQRKDKKYLLLRNISAYLIKKAYQKVSNSDRIQNYCENSIEAKISLAQKDYIDLRNLSSGASSYVKLIFDIEREKLFAMKIITNRILFEREKNNYLNLKYPFLAKIYGTAKYESHDCLVLEFIEGKTLTKAKTNIKEIFNNSKEMIKVIYQMMISFNYLHNLNFIIRDIHLNNFLVDSKNKTIVLIDFDRMHENSLKIEDSINSEYLSPESVTRNIFTVKSDICSLGYVIRSFKWSGLDDSDKIDAKKFNDFIDMFTQKDPEERLPLSELIKNFYLDFIAKFPSGISELDSFQSIDDINDEKYKDYLIYLAEPDNPFSLTKLAKIYQKGTLFRKDIYKAIKYYSLAVSQGNQEAITNLQNIFNEIVKNDQKSFGNCYNFQSSIIDSIQNEDLRDLYKKFNFINYPSKLNLNDFLKDFKFITYDHSNSDQTVICAEGLVVIHDSNEIKLDKTESINLTSSKNDDLITIEVNNFCEYYKDEIENNEFVRITIRPISAFIISRFSCPSSYFKDVSFFTFNHNFPSYEYKTKSKLYEIFDGEKNEETKLEIKKFVPKIIDKKIQDTQNNNPIYNFQINDFIILRNLYSDDYSKYELAIHKKSFFVFMIKRIDNEHLFSDEIEFCTNYCHQYLTPFYGFIKEDEEITGLVYEYLSNGSLENFVLNHPDEVNDVFKVIAVSRIYECIYYLHTNSIQDRIIRPSNIFLDHNNSLFIIYSNNAKNYSDEGNLDFNPNLFSLGLIIYFIYEKKNLLNDHNQEKLFSELRKGNVPSISNCSNNIKEMFYLCLQLNHNKDSMIMEKLTNTLYNELKYSHLFNYYIMGPHEMTKTEYVNISYELIFYVSALGKTNQLSNIYLSFFFNIYTMFLKNKNEIPEIFYQRGFVYENGYGAEQDYKEAKRCYEYAAERGNSKALLHLGILYENGYGVEKDIKKAFDYYQKSAELKNIYAFYQLGIFYEKGIGVERDPEKAKQYFHKYGLLNPDFYYLLGFQYEKGNVFAQNYMKAREYYELAAKQKHSNAIYHLGILYLHGQGVKKDIAIALDYFKEAIKLKNPKASNYLAHLYEKGIELPKNDNLALHYYEISANLRNSSAYLHLGKLLYKKSQGDEQMLRKANEYLLKYAYSKSNLLLNIALYYENGHGIKKDYSKAKELYELAAYLNNPYANFFVGFLYLYGNGVTTNPNRAKEYFEKNKNTIHLAKFIYVKPKNGNQYYKNSEDYTSEVFNIKSNDFYDLARFYQKGYGIIKNNSLAMIFFKLSAQLNNAKAQIQLGINYENGFNLAKDIFRAKDYFLKASQQNNSIAFLHLGMISEEELNFSEAKKNYELAARQNNHIALLKLGQMHHHGKGVKQDYSEAEKNYKLAAQFGNSDSYLILGDLYYKGEGVEQNYSIAEDYYKKSSNLKNADAAMKLAVMYYNGIGVDVNVKQSIYYYLNCIDYEKDKKYNSPSFYRSNNDIGLIYIVENQDVEKAANYIKTSGLNEYPIGLNSYGLYCQLYLKNNENAKHFFKEASLRYNLSLAEYNLAYLYEKENNIDESINYYIKASQNEVVQICFRNEIIDDQMFQESQNFIVYFINFKLILHFLIKDDFKNTKEYFIKALLNKLFLESSNEYSFVFSSLKQFLFNVYSKIEADSICKNLSYKQKETKNSDSHENHNFIQNINNINYLFNWLFNDSYCKSQLKTEIEKIINDVNNVLYCPPYSILFGRMNYQAKSKSNEAGNPKTIKNITKPFYDGFEIE